MPEQKAPDFLSYSRDDKEFALRIVHALKDAGASVWLDQLDIPTGARWDRSIETALRACPRLLLILSPSSVVSDNVMDEVSYALEHNKPVIPILYRDCEVPFRLRRLQYIDFRGRYEIGLQSMLLAVGIVQPPPVPTPVPKLVVPVRPPFDAPPRLPVQVLRPTEPAEEIPSVSKTANPIEGPAVLAVPNTQEELLPAPSPPFSSLVSKAWLFLSAVALVVGLCWYVLSLGEEAQFVAKNVRIESTPVSGHGSRAVGTVALQFPFKRVFSLQEGRMLEPADFFLSFPQAALVSEEFSRRLPWPRKDATLLIGTSSTNPVKVVGVVRSSGTYQHIDIWLPEVSRLK